MCHLNGLVLGLSGGTRYMWSLQYFELVKIASEYAGNKINTFAGITAISTNEALTKLDKLLSLDLDGVMCTQ